MGDVVECIGFLGAHNTKNHETYYLFTARIAEIKAIGKCALVVISIFIYIT